MIRGDLSKFKAAMQRLSKDMDKKVAKVGWFEGDLYPDGTPVAYVAAIQEYGAPERGIPARPFIRPAIAAHQKEWAQTIADGTKEVIRGNATTDQVLESVGQKAQGDIQAQINSGDHKPLSDITLLLRKWRRQGKPITGKTVGQAAAALKAARQANASKSAKRKADISKVNADPLQDTGLLATSLIYTVDKA